MIASTGNGNLPDPRRIHLFVFDLDGTLIDSKLDLALAVNATRQQYTLGPLLHEKIYGYIGDGARMLIQRSLDDSTTEEQIDDALRFFIRYYSEHALDNTVPYPGVAEGLERLGSDGHLLTVLTNKPVLISRDILSRMGLAKYFRVVYGGNSFETKKPDPLGLEMILRECNAQAEETLMVGDSPVDIHTARNAGVWACAVSYGLGSHLLGDAPPDLRVDSLAELAAWAQD